jgi:hypothetical protein
MSRSLARIDSTKSDGYEVVEPVIEQKPSREYLAETHRCRPGLPRCLTSPCLDAWCSSIASGYGLPSVTEVHCIYDSAHLACIEPCTTQLTFHACLQCRVVSLAGPISLQAALVFVSSLVSIAFAGHLGRLPLSQAVLASSCYNITGAAVLYGLASGMETLCGQVGSSQFSHHTFTLPAVLEPNTLDVAVHAISIAISCLPHEAASRVHQRNGQVALTPAVLACDMAVPLPSRAHVAC